MDCSKVRRTALQMLLKMTECACPVVTASALWLGGLRQSKTVKAAMLPANAYDAALSFAFRGQPPVQESHA